MEIEGFTNLGRVVEGSLGSQERQTCELGLLRRPPSPGNRGKINLSGEAGPQTHTNPFGAIGEIDSTERVTSSGAIAALNEISVAASEVRLGKLATAIAQAFACAQSMVVPHTEMTLATTNDVLKNRSDLSRGEPSRSVTRATKRSSSQPPPRPQGPPRSLSPV